jgi:hypothetical protein
MGRRKCCCDPTSKCETACTNWEYTAFELFGLGSSHKWGNKTSNSEGNVSTGTSNGISYGGMPVNSSFDLSFANGTYVVNSGDISIADWKTFTGNTSVTDEYATGFLPCYGLQRPFLNEPITPIQYSAAFPEYIRTYQAVFPSPGCIAVPFVGSSSTTPSGTTESELGSAVYINYTMSMTVFRGFLSSSHTANPLNRSNDINSVSEFVQIGIGGTVTVPASATCTGGAQFSFGSLLAQTVSQVQYNCCPSTPHNIYKRYYNVTTQALGLTSRQFWKMNLTRNSNIGKQNKPASGIFGYTCSPYVRTTSSGGRRVTSSNDPRIVG